MDIANLLKKLKIESKFVYEKLQFTKNNTLIDIPVHFWNEFNENSS